MSFHEISIAVRAENRTMGIFRTIASDVFSLGVAFGALDSQTGRSVMQIFSVIRLMTSLKAILATTTAATVAHSTATGVQTTLQGYAITTTSGHSISLIAHSVANYIASAATWVLNAALAMKIALLTLGIGLVIATAAYMAWLASTTRDAASAQADYNAELSKTPSRSIRRAGEEDYYRRGVEY
jgi:hypothetical protein